jgi:hypothetical protein
MKKHGLNIKLLFADFLEKGTFCSEINLYNGSKTTNNGLKAQTVCTRSCEFLTKLAYKYLDSKMFFLYSTND